MTHQLISVEEFCVHHHTEMTFLQDLHDQGLIVLTIVDTKLCIATEELVRVEKMVHLYKDLDINVAGLASISHLLNKVEKLQRELWATKNKLRFYED
ncbi:chaperone modulator CbpM [Mucilaginibacter myungsuensis]|uniref:Chaperone modulator CbpM n=1 Tax=Mucilaginibacter myungsuensis TaxID=649104 RepID=A0A929KUE4_9SPHI|nr:chaperone modulator CbpM [Mucilaginibacter myungsuensis]MBE9661749.1 chaperone modulator CbpM [Mucilaginibacter myungsuensis]MDN3599819.1 chaperone modulator CbpM [Mucilaginibacter myungsuensis]